MAKILVVYYSSGKATAEAAEKIAAALGADLERIDTLKAYPEDYEAMTAQGQKEVEEGLTPEIKPLEHDLKDYDTIVLGTPTWWYTMAPAVLTLLRTCDFSKKTVLPFQTHVGQPGHVMPDIRKELARAEGAMLFKGLRLEYDEGKLTAQSEREFSDWLDAVKKELA